MFSLYKALSQCQAVRKPSLIIVSQMPCSWATATELKASFPVLPPTVMPDQVKEDRQLRNHRKLNTQRWFQRGQSREENVYVSPLPA